MLLPGFSTAVAGTLPLLLQVGSTPPQHALSSFSHFRMLQLVLLLNPVQLRLCEVNPQVSAFQFGLSIHFPRTAPNPLQVQSDTSSTYRITPISRRLEPSDRSSSQRQRISFGPLGLLSSPGVFLSLSLNHYSLSVSETRENPAACCWFWRRKEEGEVNAAESHPSPKRKEEKRVLSLLVNPV